MTAELSATSSVEQLKTRGNEAFGCGDHAEAVKLFSEAIALDPMNHFLFSNRSAAYCASRDYEKALEDAEKCVQFQPGWSKGYGRKAAALFGLLRLAESKQMYEKGLEIEPGNAQLKKGLMEVATAESEAGQRPQQADFLNRLKSPFGSPEAMARLQANPTTRAFLSQPDFLQKLSDIRASPSNTMKHMQDSRILQAMMVAMGVDMKEPTGPLSTADAGDDTARPSKFKDACEQAEEPETEPAALSRSLSDQEKEQGNQAYAKRDFESAHKHYDTALSTDPTNITVLNNKAAVYFEQENYDECVEVCEQAVEKGRELHADFKIIAKALGRIGSAYAKKGNDQDAIKYFNKSLAEHRSPDVLAKLRDLERQVEIRAKEAYHDPVMAEKERNAGNELFKRGEFVEALKHYHEAIKREEQDPRNYSNRAACYTKLASLPEALRDCDKSIECDPTFVKAYIRKANIFMMTKEFQKVFDALALARQQNPDDRLKAEIDDLSMKAYYESANVNGQLSPEDTLKKAMQDPEVQKIMSDPIMQTILQQMQSDPKAVSEHMKNPMVASSIRKLMAAGIIRTA